MCIVRFVRKDDELVAELQRGQCGLSAGDLAEPSPGRHLLLPTELFPSLTEILGDGEPVTVAPAGRLY